MKLQTKILIALLGLIYFNSLNAQSDEIYNKILLNENRLLECKASILESRNYAKIRKVDSLYILTYRFVTPELRKKYEGLERYRFANAAMMYDLEEKRATVVKRSLKNYKLLKEIEKKDKLNEEYIERIIELINQYEELQSQLETYEKLTFNLKECHSKISDLQVTFEDVNKELDDVFPSFPNKLPKASCTFVLPRMKFQELKNLGESCELISSNLKGCGYNDLKYFSYDNGNGYVVLTPLEALNNDGSPKTGDARWETNQISIIGEFSIMNYLKALFFRNRGYYRVMAFVVSKRNIFEDEEPPSKNKLNKLFKKGTYNFLPPEISQLEFSEKFNCYSLIYEFEVHEYGEMPKCLEEHNNNGEKHLRVTKILEKFEH